MGIGPRIRRSGSGFNLARRSGEGFDSDSEVPVFQRDSHCQRTEATRITMKPPESKSDALSYSASDVKATVTQA